MSTIPRFTVEELVSLGRRIQSQAPCATCSALVCPGWESMPSGFDASSLERIGTLRNPEHEDPTVVEFHPDGTNAWSVNAPISPDHFPYNRCEVWRCKRCGRPFLRYTEYGGYYVDERIRELNADRIRVP